MSDADLACSSVDHCASPCTRLDMHLENYPMWFELLIPNNVQTYNLKPSYWLLIFLFVIFYPENRLKRTP